MTAPHTSITGLGNGDKPATIFGRDFPFPYYDWLERPDSRFMSKASIN